MRKTKFSIMVIAVSLMALVVAAVPANAEMGVWRDINPDAYISPPANPQLNSLYMLSPTEGWAVGDSRPSTDSVRALPAIFHYDGDTWNLVPAPKFPDFPLTQSPYNLTSVTFGPPNNPISRNDGWAVGFNGTVGAPGPFTPASVALHWDGITWRVQVAGLTGADAGPLWSAFMVSSTDVWAVGQNRAGTAGVFWHWTGVSGLGGGWNEPQAAVVGTFFYSVFMVSPTEGWAVGSGGAIWHYFGGTWSAFSSPVTTNLRSVFMLSPTEGWAVGEGGVIIRYTGGTWAGPVSPGTTSNNLLSVFLSASTEGWAVGERGTILHYTGGTWSAIPSNSVPTSPVASMNLNSAYFNAANDGWIVGSKGVILHYDGVNHGTVTSPTINNFTSVSFGPPLIGPFNPNDGWAVGNASTTTPFEPTIYHWNGFVWTKGVAIGATNNLNSVYMINTGDVWTVGGGSRTTSSCSAALCPVILHFTGGSWNTITPPPGSYELRSVFMVSPNEGWSVGAQVGAPPTGIILHYTVTGGVGTWAIFPAPTTPTAPAPLNSVFMLGPNEGWAVGDNATILHYTVTGGVGSWNAVTVSGTPGLSRDANLTSVFMLSPTSGWAVGGIKAAGSMSDKPVIIYWDGTKWTPVATPSIPGGITTTGLTTGILKSVYFTGPNDGWAVGYPGILMANILHWNGVSWNHVSLTPALLGEIPPILTSVFMTSPSNGWIVGSSPGFTSATYFADPTGYPKDSNRLKPLSTILRFSPFGAISTATSTLTVVSTLSTNTVAATTTISTITSPTCGPNIAISIKVVDSQGNPISGATVSIPASPPCLPSGVQGVTNAQGIVTFNVPAGSYTVSVTRGGNSATQSITVTSSSQVFTITLSGLAGGGIPGFPVESIIAGVVLGVATLTILRRRSARRHAAQ